MAQLGLGKIRDSNPYPAAIESTDTRKLTEIIRRQHEKFAAGDTTFSWELLTRTSSMQLYNLGAIGRFYHPDYGLILARYVQFGAEITAQNLGCPVGLIRNQNLFTWRVTNVFSASDRLLFAGLVGSFSPVAADDYGWVIYQGINIQSLVIESTTRPQQMDQPTWASDNQLAKSVAGGLGFIAGNNSITQIDATHWEIAPAGFFVDTDSTPQSYDDSGLLAKVEVISASLKDYVSKSEYASLVEKYDKLAANTNSMIEILQRQIESVDVNPFMQEIQSQINLAANFRALTAVDSANASNAALASFNRLQATNQASQLAIIAQNGAEQFAIAAKNERIEANFQSYQSGLSASASATSASNASVSETNAGLSAAASLAYSVNASLMGLQLNLNSLFIRWPVANAYPDNWVTWSGTPTRTATPNGLSFAPQFNVTSSTDNRGMYASPISDPGLTNFRKGWYVLTFQFKIISGTNMRGLGLLLQGLDSGLGFVTDTSLIPEYDVSSAGVVETFVAGQTYTYTKLVDLTGAAWNSVTQLNIYAMANFVGEFGAGGAVKNVQILNTGIRSATVGEIESGKVAAIGASVTTEIAARVAGDNALASLITALTSTVNANTAAITSEATTRANADSAISSIVSSLTTTVAGNTASISAQATSISGLQAKYGLRLNVNNHIIGFELNNGGGTGQAIFNVDDFIIANATGSTVPFKIVGGVTYIKSAVIEDLSIGTLKIAGDAVTTMKLASNAAAKPSTISSGVSITGAGVGVYLSSLGLYVVLDRDATIFATVTAAQSFPSGDRSYDNQLIIDGANVFNVGGAKTTDSVTLSGSRNLPAGTYLVEHKWAAHSTVSLQGRTMFVCVIY